VSEGYNLADYDPAGLLTGPHDQINADAKLDPLGLQDNGGPTPTIALLATSPALDRGNSFGVFADQRGSLRPVDNPFVTNVADGADIGAYEATDALQTGEPNFNVNSLDDHDDGIAGVLDCTLRKAINRANAISGCEHDSVPRRRHHHVGRGARSAQRHRSDDAGGFGAAS
jgi:CSLREA domain-containing protein